MAAPKGGIKLRRSKKRKTTYAAQFARTARNKIRRATKRLKFDKMAEGTIRRWQLKQFRTGPEK